MLRLWSAFRSLWLAAACAACMPAHGSTPDAAPDAPIEPWRQWRSVLFRVLPPAAAAPAPPQAADDDAAGADGASASTPVNYVFGTIHFGELDELEVDADILREAMRHTRVLVNEVDGATRWDAAKERYRLLDDPAGLPGLIGQAAFAELARLLPHVPPSLLARLKPWAALALLEARNERWLPKLETLLRRGGAFVAVGAIHLTGSAGLLERLRRRGFLIVAEPM
ncbi:TraB/GumN family protein [uncultured Pigmentiphaga sp.]|uniref:TraB/GumN family protein n=1 Tax=uncultured Pigmentiphaga sp. TaxID=340361 RepID=UPI00261CE5A6|nr:TraB/GumN family protein [uncultured Pigmentiphaga sp.]